MSASIEEVGLRSMEVGSGIDHDGAHLDADEGAVPWRTSTSLLSLVTE